MNKIFALIILMLILSNTVTAQHPEFQWVQNMKANEGLVASMTLDKSGHIYITGVFGGTADFDPGVGVYNLTAAGLYSHSIVKLDASGNFIWARSFGGAVGSSTNGSASTVDASGNVYTTGYFGGAVDFDPGVGTYSLTVAGSGKDAYIVKLDASGNFVWAKQLSGTDYGMGISIAVDASGNTYTTGLYRGTVDFDPGVGTYNLTGIGGETSFIVKLDNDGNFLWAKQFLGKPGGTSGGFGIALDNSGNVYTTGRLSGTVDFDPGSGTYNITSYRIFVSKLDADGNFVWAKGMGGGDGDGGVSIALDAAGNVYTTGGFRTGDFDPGSGIYNLTDLGQGDIFISKLDNDGNFVWAKSIGGNLWDYGYSIATDALGNVYTTGWFRGTADFDPGTGVYNLTVAGEGDIFISKLDASGNLIWTGQIGGNYNDEGRSVAPDASGNLYIAGNFESTAIDFDPGSGTYNVSSSGGWSKYILKMSGGCMAGGKLIITASQDTICRGTPSVLDVTGTTGNVQWQSSVTGSNFTGISGATGANYISQDTANSYFRVYTSDANCPDTSDVFKLVVQPSPVADFISSGSGTDITFTDKSKGATIYDWDFGDGSTGTEQNPVHTYASAGSYRVCLTVFNGSNCSFTTCRDIEAGTGTGVTLIEADNQLNIYPNPFIGSITIEQTSANNPIESIEVYDLLGRKVYEQQFSSDQTSNSKLRTVNFSALADGMYFLKLKTKDRTVTLFRTVKNRADE